MPYYQIMLSGKGISLPSENNSEDPIIRFFTTQIVKASNPIHAAQRAKDLVLTEWLHGKYAANNNGSPPLLIVESNLPINLFKGLFGRKRTGYVFYANN